MLSVTYILSSGFFPVGGSCIEKRDFLPFIYTLPQGSKNTLLGHKCTYVHLARTSVCVLSHSVTDIFVMKCKDFFVYIVDICRQE